MRSQKFYYDCNAKKKYLKNFQGFLLILLTHISLTLIQFNAEYSQNEMPIEIYSTKLLFEKKCFSVDCESCDDAHKEQKQKINVFISPKIREPEFPT